MNREGISIPFVTVSSKGLKNGLSGIENDGADFGPDTPGTSSSGIVEAIKNSKSGNVMLLEGEFYTREQIIISEGINLSGNQKSIIINELEDPFVPVLVFRPYSSSSFLIVNANGKSGIKIGEQGNNSIKIDYVKVYNAGNIYAGAGRENVAVTITGYNIIADVVDVYKGNIGLKIAGGSDIRITDLQVVESSTGLVVVSSEHVTFEHLSIDSCSYIGVQIDASNDVTIRGIVWNNVEACPSNTLKYGLLIGDYSSGYRNNGLTIELSIVGTGGTGVKISNANLCTLNLKIANGVFHTKDNEIKTGIEYGDGLSLISVSALMSNVESQINGAVGGRLILNGDIKENSHMH